MIVKKNNLTKESKTYIFKNLIFKKNEYIGLILILFITTLVYLNHFNNPFFFDDTHTISGNESIRNLTNWLTFFIDADTFSSLPANRAYRPMVTLMNAIDYAIAGKLDSRYYHYHIFTWFLVLILLVYALSKHLYILSNPKNKWIIITALFATSWFALHTANAETINYICARSDSFSTLCIVASLLLYIHPFGRKWHLYIITMIIGILTKQTGVMFFPILCTYVLLFEEYSLLDNFRKNTKEKLLNIFKKVAVASTIAISIFIINQYYLTPKSTDSTNYFVTRFEYISTQCFVILHYLGNFIFPINLSADPDIAIIKPWYNIKIILGLMVIISMAYVMIKTAFKKELRPISFGIAWFFIALLPTTLNPLFQIANDHRMFFPFIGLFIAIPWGLLAIVTKYNILTKENSYPPSRIAIALVLILAGHAYGTIHRNKIWQSGDSLWLDVTLKSPKNGRGLMNYGLTHMTKGNYETALEYFNRALKLIPNYYTLHINLGILYSATKNHKKAIKHYKSAIKLNTSSSEPEYHYAKYLAKQNKYNEAFTYLQKAIRKSPNDYNAKKLLKQISKNIIPTEKEIEILKRKIETNPSAELYLQLSLKYYETRDYKTSINTCKTLLKLYPDNSGAYNNICASYNQLKQWDLGAEACKKALEIAPNYQLAKNNLKWATDNIIN